MKTLQIAKLETAKIRPSENNPRKRFPAGRLAEIRESMRESGLIQPITVRPVGGDFEVVAGECRFRCARDLGWDEIDCVIREMDDQEVATVQMAENVARNALNPIEELGGVSRMVSLGMDAEEVARRLGLKVGWVQGRLRLGELPVAAKQAVAGEKLSLSAAEAILRVDESEREEATQDLLQFGDELTTANAMERLRERYLRPRENRKRWWKWWDKAKESLEELGEPIEDPEAWGEYVLSYGKPQGKWKRGDDRIGSAAARVEDERLTWADLAKALGVRGKLVPVGGVQEGFENVVMLYDGGVIASAEKAARKSGLPYTLGKREAAEVEGGGKLEVGSQKSAVAEGQVGDDEGQEGDSPGPCERCGELLAPDGVCENWECFPEGERKKAVDMRKIAKAVEILGFPVDEPGFKVENLPDWYPKFWLTITDSHRCGAREALQWVMEICGGEGGGRDREPR